MMHQRFPFALAAIVLVALAVPAVGQSARAVGSVRDLEGRPLKGATIRATNPDAYPPQISSVTDDKGRFAMIGLRTGTWQFVAEAPGYLPVEASAPMRVAGAPPLVFSLARDPGPIPDALAGNIQQQLVAANKLRDEGRLDQAIAAYREIGSRNPKLTSINFAVAGTLRKKAAIEGDPAARRALLDQAIATYSSILEADGANDRATSELASTRVEASSTSR
jgi:hypothetical protein